MSTQMNATDLMGVGLAKLDLGPRDVLIIFCPDEWSTGQVMLFERWMETAYPRLPKLLLSDAFRACIVDNQIAGQLRLLDGVEFGPDGRMN